MPKKNKPAAKGPFFFFMLEYKDKQEAKGIRFKGGMMEIMELAGPHWDKLTPNEREKYTQKAKEYKANPIVGERYTAQGIPYSQVERATQQRLAREEQIKKDIDDMIKQAVTANALEELEALFISCNYFCVTSSNRYIPAELAMVKYSLYDGIIDKLHILINPQKVPLGMCLDAERHTNDTHKLPLPPKALGESNYEVVLQQILYFIREKDSKAKQLPPVFTFNSDMPMVGSILAEIVDAAESDDPQFKVYPLNDYFYALKSGTEKYGLDIETFPSVFMAKALIEKDVYAYSLNIGCDVHEGMDNAVSCALSKCVRWAYTISDSCCLDLGIEMLGGRHIPANMTLLSDVTDTISVLSSRVSKLTTITNSTTTQGKQRRPRSSERGLKVDIDQTGTTIFSSRAGTTTKTSNPPPGPSKDARDQRTINETFNTTNPFYALQMENNVQEAKRNSTKPNPWSRENRLSEVRPPLQEATPAVALAGRGRGTLIKTLNDSGSVKAGGRGCLN